jgi:DNA polymerase-1
LKSTYADGLLNVIDKTTGRIYSNFNQTATATGRLSSTEPNLQNIPIKLEAGRLIRKMFVAKEGYKFIDADYSQIELRVLAHMAQDEKMIEAFNNNEDIHTSTAMQIFHVSKEEVTPILRSRAKAVNFGIVYGQREFSLSEDLGITRREAKEYIDSYFEHFDNIKTFMQGLINFGEEKGYVETIFARRRYLPELKASNFHVRSLAQRMAMNMPIQGSAADIIKIAMIKVYERLKGMKSKIVLQVHDELIVEAAEEELEEVSDIVKSSMEEAVKLKVKLKADLNAGRSWMDAK